MSGSPRTAQPNRHCDVGAYYGGASYYLLQKLEIEDVRLVYAPALGIGNFGGQTDNWMRPRHTGHFGFYRAYVAPDGSSRPYARQTCPTGPRTGCESPLKAPGWTFC
ncbi:S46 family peptidase [Mesorhizobium sp. M0598]|uniref:S46 family peptidase n=1 Tax=Mesorhizobium sp. M0598 TaxID=2956968 RepID=UPI003334DC2E